MSVSFLPVGGKLFRFSTLTLREQDELAEYLRYRYMEEAHRQIDGLPPDLARYAYDRAKEKTDRIYPGCIEHKDAVFTFHGLMYALWLAGHKNHPEFTQDDAAGLLHDRPDSFAVASKVMGYEASKGAEKSKNEPLPVAEIIRTLTNEPYCHTPREAAEMTLEEIALIWNRDDIGEPQIDQQAFIAAWRKKREQAALGIWGGNSIWK